MNFRSLYAALTIETFVRDYILFTIAVTLVIIFIIVIIPNRGTIKVSYYVVIIIIIRSLRFLWFNVNVYNFFLRRIVIYALFFVIFLLLLLFLLVLLLWWHLFKILIQLMIVPHLICNVTFFLKLWSIGLIY